MTYELWILVGASILGLFHVLLGAALPYSRKGYFEWNASPRDEPFDLGPKAERVKRGFNNFMETFAFFAVIIVCLNFAGKSDIVSIAGSSLYLVARIVYIPLYAFGIKGVRSAVWILSLIGILMCLYSLFV